MNATFGVVSILIPGLQRAYLTHEDLNPFPVSRIIFITGTIALYFLTSSLIFKNYCQISKKIKFSQNLQLVYIFHSLSYAFHSTHYADNIYRPSAYAEPKWLYEKYIFAEMEITFFTNFPISLFGLLGLKNLGDAIIQQSIRSLNRGKIFLNLYVGGSLLTMGHYLTQPPSYYSHYINFTIGMEGLVTVVLGFLAAKLVRDVSLVIMSNREVTGDLDQLIPGDKSGRDTKGLNKSGLRARTPTNY